MHPLRRFAPLFTLFALGCGNAAPQRVVLYCAQDQEFADAVLADFNRETGLTVTPKFDTEADKSVSLVTELQHEAQRPRCDIHWNNEIVGTIRTGVGAGIRLTLPIFGQLPLALDFGIPITKDDQDDTRFISFSLGFVQ